MEKQEVKEYLKKQYPKFKGFIDHTLVAEMAMNFANMQLAKINYTRCCKIDSELLRSSCNWCNGDNQPKSDGIANITDIG
jgi:hypothetical protein